MLGDKECSIVGYDHRLRSGGQVTTLAPRRVFGALDARDSLHTRSPRERARCAQTAAGADPPNPAQRARAALPLADRQLLAAGMPGGRRRRY